MKLRKDPKDRQLNLIKLKDGRHLSYLELGNPKGIPTFYFHGTPSSKFEAYIIEEYALASNIRLISLDRPGMGNSSFQENRSFLDWPNDVLETADYLNLDKFSIVGHSGAGPYLLACAHEIPERLTFVGAFCPFAPIDPKLSKSELNKLDRFYFSLTKRFPFLMQFFFAPLGFLVKYTPSIFFRIMKANVCQADKIELEKPKTFALFTRAIQESFHIGAKGPAYEAALEYNEWKFSLNAITYPIHIWLGEEDIWISSQMREKLQSQLPNATIHIMKGRGHFNYSAWTDIFFNLNKHSTRTKN